MKICSRCLYPENHALNIVFDEYDVCSGCRVHEEKDTLDWTERGMRLQALVDKYRSRTRKWDCVVPISGAGDSYFIVNYVKNILGLNPLLVTYNKHYNTRLGIRNTAFLRTVFNADIIVKTVDPRIAQKVTRETLTQRGSIYWHILAGQTALPVQIATKFRVPLVIWGAHQGLDQVGMYSHLDEVEMTARYRREHDLMGLDEEYLDGQGGITESDLEAYKYPAPRAIADVGVRGIYLGNYIRWDSKAQHEKMINQFNFETANAQRTIDSYNYSDCHHYAGLHDYIKYRKFGYGKITDNLSREIRFGRITRKEALQLAATYNHIFPTDIPLMAQWLKISASNILDEVEQHADKNVARPSRYYSKNKLPEIAPPLKFVETSVKDKRKDDQYLLFAKGFTH